LSAKTTTQESSNEEIDTNRKLKFVEYILELTKRDPEWKATLKEKAEAFRRLEV
jgi:hypothetical protein